MKPERKTGSTGEGSLKRPISIEWKRVGRQILAIVLIGLGLSILLWPLLHVTH